MYFIRFFWFCQEIIKFVQDFLWGTADLFLIMSVQEHASLHWQTFSSAKKYESGVYRALMATL
ncbi:MAG TPA: hypothetical protein DCY48_02600 [Candidatus Magasanikbacteria bacterium]|uniref:Uncharacterized protein n=1 Tax=Candidatus Magasanikbacteria bacterium GW2011_GWA2_46_17 TaxID=1619042 RepID=A0A0G1S0S7_9BACT|nr:MAG: hypothetical protein UX39_C0006G0027 [Candidatus Magasanikbacteria bacterium GW2011_GWA2_46_17]OGH77676.1 MAG: hypothetical protein A3I74_02870 [Candidatus Magasanikbacteria bacterium RIFCSPLOWO2_02_FULL_47_16]OGH79565.1 MAG: hypothetical protein A3C10_00535 [Candidatus Magasanikbacteria bacterium RIFCSPHIGHO2_02_FULL_48_18]OGH83292.1 MAG: hypothetical protein A3G08_04190 [Candidatus Magasanikbacteria bacterium RIFCSPLOWO2_12_FULL_47_9b]HAZ28643.1 hypothetical protein [Candidatus Magasa